MPFGHRAVARSFPFPKSYVFQPVPPLLLRSVLHPVSARSLLYAASPMSTLKTSVDDLVFQNTITVQLSCDPLTPGTPFERPESRNAMAHTPRQVRKAHFSYVEPEEAPEPYFIAASTHAGREIDLDIPTILASPEERQKLVDFVAGIRKAKGSNPWAYAYAGHQFGSFAGQLGDGRAISLGEVVNTRGRRWELQLKGAGMTPYSRFADGYAVLRSSIREFLCSEAMFHLGIPTTRALALIGSSRIVQREQDESGAIVCRLAPSWIRLGNFELFYATGDSENLQKLADYAITMHFPEIQPPDGSVDGPQTGKYTQLLERVVAKTAEMIAHWQAYGFCHGVMNTDNFSILGLTIDYGPFQFLDGYDPDYVCNKSDFTGMYAFSEQPEVGLRNMVKFATAISPLIIQECGGDREKASGELRPALNQYSSILSDRYGRLMAKKIGLATYKETDLQDVIYPLLTIIAKEAVDYTLFFRSLSQFSIASTDALYPTEACSRTGPTEPRLIIAQAKPSLGAALQPWLEIYRKRLLEDISGPDESCPLVTASREAERRKQMDSINPRYILRNHLAQTVIEAAEVGNYAEVNELLNVLSRPFEDGSIQEQERWGGAVPDWAAGVKCSCSS